MAHSRPGRWPEHALRAGASPVERLAGGHSVSVAKAGHTSVFASRLGPRTLLVVVPLVCSADADTVRNWIVTQQQNAFGLPPGGDHCGAAALAASPGPEGASLLGAKRLP